MMKRSSRPKPSNRRDSDEQERQNVVRQLKIIALFSIVAAGVAAVVMTWDQMFPTPQDKLVTVYRVHRCGCVTQWVRMLKDEGFTVRLFELDSLRAVRRTLGTPADMRGCHVAEYLNYFVEGHVPANMLQQLARERPSATGIATQADLSDSAYRVNVATAYSFILVGKDGTTRPWDQNTAQ